MNSKIYPLAYKPDLEEAARRWEAFYVGEIIARPIVLVSAPVQEGGSDYNSWIDYYPKVFDDLETILDKALKWAEATYFGGESAPGFFTSFGPDEIAVFCGAELCWNDESAGTNWSKPFINDWKQELPLQMQENHPLWQRMLEFYRLAAKRFEGKLLLHHLDLHTNMDLLAAARGPGQLCVDLIEQPEMIDVAMESARAIYRKVWYDIAEVGKMNERGYYNGVYSMNGAATLQCDFSCMISPEMFHRWVLPALEEEAEISKHVYYHWDGPDAIVHLDDLCSIPNLHVLGFVPGEGNGSHTDWMDLLKRVQKKGKAVHFIGSPDECKAAHRELEPDKVMYSTGTSNVKEAEDLLKWFADNT